MSSPAANWTEPYTATNTALVCPGCRTRHVPSGLPYRVTREGVLRCVPCAEAAGAPAPTGQTPARPARLAS